MNINCKTLEWTNDIVAAHAGEINSHHTPLLSVLPLSCCLQTVGAYVVSLIHINTAHPPFLVTLCIFGLKC